MTTKTQEKYKLILKNAGVKKVIPYKSYKEFSSFTIERINPDHVGLVWGHRKHSNPVKCAKVFFGIIPFVILIGFFDLFTAFVFNIIMQIGVYSLCTAVAMCFVIWFDLFKEVAKCGSKSWKSSYCQPL